jgi:phosphoribosylglycinamide formyltransferase-1
MNTPLRVAFCVSGGGRLFRAAANQAGRLGIKPVQVIAETKADAELDSFCAARSIPLHRLEPKPRAEFDRKLTSLCLEAELDLLCLSFDKILPPELVRRYPGRIINVHPALLPAFKGMNALDQAVDFGARFSGATIHEVKEEVDSGAIIAQCVLGLRRRESAEAFGRRLFGNLRLMFLQVLAWYAAGRVAKDDQGRIWIQEAIYGEFPISPAVEQAFPE